MSTPNQEKKVDNAGWSNKAVALSKLGRHEEALLNFNVAVEIDPNDSAIWYNRGLALEKLGRLEEAVKSYEKATELDSKDAEAWCNKGVVLYKLSRFNESVASLEKAIELNHNYQKAWYNKGFSLEKLDRNEEAKASFEKSLKLSPKYQGGSGDEKVTSDQYSFVNAALQKRPVECCIEIKEFFATYDAISDGLRKQGTSEIADALWLNLTGVCPLCGWKLTGEDLGNIWMMGQIGFDRVIIKNGPGRSLRFGKGYCLNENCSSNKIVFFWRPYYEMFKEPKDVQVVINILEKERDWFIRQKAAEALGKTGDLSAVEPLIRALKDKEGAALKDRQANEKADVRHNAAVALGKIGDQRAVKPLENLLEDSDEYKMVQEAAQSALEEIKKRT
jgi:tetratricopeptide (TPR) repeat protein